MGAFITMNHPWYIHLYPSPVLIRSWRFSPEASALNFPKERLDAWCQRRPNDSCHRSGRKRPKRPLNCKMRGMFIPSTYGMIGIYRYILAYISMCYSMKWWEIQQDTISFWPPNKWLCWKLSQHRQCLGGKRPFPLRAPTFVWESNR